MVLNVLPYMKCTVLQSVSSFRLTHKLMENWLGAARYGRAAEEITRRVVCGVGKSDVDWAQSSTTPVLEN